LGSWRSNVASRYKNEWKNLILRLVVLGMVIVGLAAVAKVLRRITVNYVHDANRRRTILLIQRIVVWLVLILVVAFAFASDLSSLATFLGLLTAGIAVALQNVILAALGYFLLIGKMGIRVGDRVQISGVAGYVTYIGLLQFQLREVDEKGQPTDRVASFSNSFVFVSPATGLFKVIVDDSRSNQPEVGKEVPRA
jgi:small-conductance mechanosensitive channel